MKMINIKENLPIVWTIWRKWKFSEKMWLDNIKTHKKQAFNLSLKNTFLEKPYGGMGSNWTPSQAF